MPGGAVFQPSTIYTGSKLLYSFYLACHLPMCDWCDEHLREPPKWFMTIGYAIIMFIYWIFLDIVSYHCIMSHQYHVTSYYVISYHPYHVGYPIISNPNDSYHCPLSSIVAAMIELPWKCRSETLGTIRWNQDIRKNIGRGPKKWAGSSPLATILFSGAKC